MYTPPPPQPTNEILPVYMYDTFYISQVPRVKVSSPANPAPLFRFMSPGAIGQHQVRNRRTNWSEDETTAMLTLWKQKTTTSSATHETFIEIASAMEKEYGFTGFASGQVQSRLQNLRTKYRQLRANATQEELEQWPYFEYFSRVQEERPGAEPASQMQ